MDKVGLPQNRHLHCFHRVDLMKPWLWTRALISRFGSRWTGQTKLLINRSFDLSNLVFWSQLGAVSAFKATWTQVYKSSHELLSTLFTILATIWFSQFNFKTVTQINYTRRWLSAADAGFRPAVAFNLCVRRVFSISAVFCFFLFYGRKLIAAGSRSC